MRGSVRCSRRAIQPPIRCGCRRVHQCVIKRKEITKSGEKERQVQKEGRWENARIKKKEKKRKESSQRESGVESSFKPAECRYGAGDSESTFAATNFIQLLDDSSTTSIIIGYYFTYSFCINDSKSCEEDIHRADSILEKWIPP